MFLHFNYLKDYHAVRNSYRVCHYQSPIVYNKSFKNGDLVYGLSAQRGNYIYRNTDFAGAKPEFNVSTIDQYRLNPIDRLYNGRFAYPSFTSSSSFETSVRNHEKYRQIMENANPYSQSFDRNTYFSRKCKAGINWAKESGNTVHYILDDINMDVVIHKHYYLQQGHSDANSISGSELRWIYRNRHDPGVQKSVQFWRNGRPANAPWVDSPEKWSQYKPKSENPRTKSSELYTDTRFKQRRPLLYDVALSEI